MRPRGIGGDLHYGRLRRVHADVRPLPGRPHGLSAEGERAVATTNRNFVGRMGHAKSEVVLASPAVAAASAVKGCLASPEDL